MALVETFTDAFTYSNGNLAGNGGWLNQYGTLQVNTNRVRNSASGVTEAVYRNSMASYNDQFIELAVPTHTGSGTRSVSGYIRYNDGTGNGYLFYYETGYAEFYRQTAYSPTSLGTAFPTLAAADVIRCEIQGTALRLYRNDTLVLSATDSTYTSGAHVGFAVGNSAGAANIEVDNWREGYISNAYTIGAAQGAYALSGQTAGLEASRILLANQGAYALSGQSTGVKRGYPLIAGQGAYSLAGQSVDLLQAGGGNAARAMSYYRQRRAF